MYSLMTNLDRYDNYSQYVICDYKFDHTSLTIPGLLQAMQQAQDKPDHTVGDIQESTKKDTEEILTESDTKDVFSSMTTDNELVLESFDPLQEINNQPKRGLCRSRIKNLIFKGSFFVVGLAILVAGGVSSQFHPYVDTLAYSNCTNDFELMNRSNSS